MGKTRIIQIAKEKPKKIKLSYEELYDRIRKVMKGHSHIDEGVDYFDFLTEHKWAISTPMGDKSRVIDGVLDCKHNCKLYAHKCRKCEGIFLLPFERSECLYCDHSEIDIERRLVRMRDSNVRPGVLGDVNPDLYAAAVKDIQEHGNGQPSSQEPEYDLDWKYLEDNI